MGLWLGKGRTQANKQVPASVASSARCFVLQQARSYVPDCTWHPHQLAKRQPRASSTSLPSWLGLPAHPSCGNLQVVGTLQLQRAIGGNKVERCFHQASQEGIHKKSCANISSIIRRLPLHKGPVPNALRYCFCQAREGTRGDCIGTMRLATLLSSSTSPPCGFTSTCRHQ